MCPQLRAIGGFLVAVLGQILRPPSLMSCCYRCSDAQTARGSLLLFAVSTRAAERLWGKALQLQHHVLERNVACKVYLLSTNTFSAPWCSASRLSAYSSSIRGRSSWCSPTFAFFPKKGPPHPCWSSPSPVCLTHGNAGSRRSEQLSPQPCWLPLYLLKNETHFYFRTDNHCQCLCSMIF